MSDETGGAAATRVELIEMRARAVTVETARDTLRILAEGLGLDADVPAVLGLIESTAHEYLELLGHFGTTRRSRLVHGAVPQDFETMGGQLIDQLVRVAPKLALLFRGDVAKQPRRMSGMDVEFLTSAYKKAKEADDDDLAAKIREAIDHELAGRHVEVVPGASPVPVLPEAEEV